MAQRAKTEQGEYGSAKDAFEDLSFENKAIFVVEAAVSTLVSGMEFFVETVSDAVDGVFESDDSSEQSKSSNGRKSTSKSKAKTGTARKRTAKKTASKKTAKRSAAKKSTARKRTSKSNTDATDSADD